MHIQAKSAALTFLNPHVLLNKLPLAGRMGAKQPGTLQAWFVASASATSMA